MKRKSPNDLITSWGGAALWVFMGVCALSRPPAWASAELDQQYKLESVGILKSWDNVDGLFVRYVASACNEFFSHQSRFVVNDLSKADSVLADSKISYAKIIADEEILGQLSRSTRSESILRTRVIKEGHQYVFTMDWLHAPQMETLATVSFQIEDPEGGKPFNSGLVSNVIQENLAKLISKVPFIAHVTGRDHTSVTLNIGSGAGIKKGDILTIGTLDEVKKHPLLKAIVDWRLISTGRVEVEQTEESITFAKVLDEEPGKEISRYQKVIEIQSAPPEEAPRKEEPRSENPQRDESPKLGYVTTGLSFGNYARQFSSANLAVSGGTLSNSGSGFTFGGQAAAEVWLTRTWFANLAFGYSTWSFSQSDLNTGTPTPVSQNGGVTGSDFMTKLDLGYSYHLADEMTGSRIWAKLGYKSNSTSMPSQGTPEYTGPISVSSIFVGTGGDLPIWDQWGVTADLNFRLFTFISQDWFPDSVSSSSDVEFALAGYLRLTSRMTLRLGLELESNGADFASGASISQKTVQIGPSLLYYF